MATDTAAGRPVGTFGRSSIVMAVVSVQLIAFSIAIAVDRPTWYAAFVVCSAAGLAVASRDGVFGVAMAALGSLLLVVVGVPLMLFVADQSPALVLDAATDPAVHHVLYLGVYAPFLAALLSLLFGVPLAYHLGRGFAGQPLIESLVDLPLVVPHSVAGIVILFGFGEGGLFGDLSVRATLVGMVLALAFVSAPYAVNAAREAFEGVDERLTYAARVHGANQWETFRRVTLPLAARGVITGGVLAWARAVSEFGAVAVVAYSVDYFFPFSGELVTAQHAPVFVYTTYQAQGLDDAGAIALLLLALSAAIFLLVRWLTATPDGSRGMP